MEIVLKISAVLFILLMPFTMHAQERTITGNVTDEQNKPFPGVNVIVKNKIKGTMTDVNGHFQLKLNGKDENILMFSFIGTATKEIEIGNQSVINVQMMPDVIGLEEVVTIGYGTIKKKDLTGSIETVSGDELLKSLNTNVTETLNGKVPGVLVTKTSNRPGSSMAVEIRGINSINFSSEPLYVIDGVPSYSGMKQLNANDIESIDILKDASSCAIYGSRGANGVVIITTKGANTPSGTVSVEYAGNVGVKFPTRIPDMIGNYGNGDEYVEYRIALWKKKYGDASLLRSDFLTDDEKSRIKNGEYYDWLREVSSPAIVTNHNVNSSGGSKNSSYSFGAGYSKDQGMVGKEDFERITANVRLEHNFSTKLKTGMSSYISNNNTNHGAEEALTNAYLIPPIVSPYDDNGDYAFIVQPTSSKINPFIQEENNLRETEAFYSSFSGFIQYEPLKSLKLKSMVAYQYDNSVYGEWVDVYTQQNLGVNPNDAYRSENKNNNIVWDNIITFDKEFFQHQKINVIGLFSMQKDTHQGSQMRGEDLPYQSYWHAIETAADISDVESYYWESSMISYMLRANYSLFDKYMFTLTGRYDGTSRLKAENRWGFMPSMAFGWQIKNEPFLKNVDAISKLRLRLSYGKSGNNNIEHDLTSTKLDMSRYTFGTATENGFGIGDEKGNANLKWEMTSEFNVGLDFGFIDSRISGTIDVYSRKTKDLILKRAVSTVNGYSSVYQNIGTTSNKGIELGLNSTNLSGKDFFWKTNFTFSLNRNRINDLYGDKQDDLGNRWFIGHPISVIYDYKQLGVWQEEEADEAKKYGQSVGHIKVEDLNGDYSIDESDYQIIGSPMPDWTAGFVNTFGYKNFDLMIDIYARIGGVYNDEFTYMYTAWDNEHWNKLNVKYWTAENRSNKYQQIGAVSYYTQVLGDVSGTFVKVRNITLGYNFSESLLKRLSLSKARCYLAVQNPFTLSDYLGSDPEIIGEDVSTQLSIYPMTFFFGLNINF